MSSILDDVTGVKRLALNENEILVVTLPRGNMPAHAWQKHAVTIRDTLSTMLLTNNVIVVGDNTELTVIKKEK